jgi:hypothetical protein
MEEKRMILTTGTRVRHIDGRTGTIVRAHCRHGGYGVSFDKRANQFEPDICRIQPINLTPTDPKLAAKWEACWPPFVNRSWTR